MGEMEKGRRGEWESGRVGEWELGRVLPHSISSFISIQSNHYLEKRYHRVCINRMVAQ